MGRAGKKADNYQLFGETHCLHFHPEKGYIRILRNTQKLPANYMVSIQCRGKNEWTYTTSPPIRLRSVYREKFVFFYTVSYHGWSHSNFHRRAKASRVLYSRPRYIY